MQKLRNLRLLIRLLSSLFQILIVKKRISINLIKKGYELFKKGKIRLTVNTNKRMHFEVAGTSDIHYVTYDKQSKKFTCDCQYFSLHQKECSHIIAVKLFLENIKKKNPEK